MTNITEQARAAAEEIYEYANANNMRPSVTDIAAIITCHVQSPAPSIADAIQEVTRLRDVCEQREQSELPDTRESGYTYQHGYVHGKDAAFEAAITALQSLQGKAGVNEQCVVCGHSLRDYSGYACNICKHHCKSWSAVSNPSSVEAPAVIEKKLIEELGDEPWTLQKIGLALAKVSGNMESVIETEQDYKGPQSLPEPQSPRVCVKCGRAERAQGTQFCTDKGMCEFPG